MLGALGSILLLVGIIWMVVVAIQTGQTTGEKVLWALVCFFCSPLGSIIFFIVKKNGMVPLLLQIVGFIIMIATGGFNYSFGGGVPSTTQVSSGGTETKWRVGLWAYAPVLLWIGVIFFLSSPEGSFEQTSRIIGPLLHFFYPSISPETEALIHGYVRKAAHFTEYAVLAFLGARACAISASHVIQRWRYVLPLLLVAAVASLDEFNQSFEGSRTSSAWDVALDISGGVAMLAFLLLIRRPRLRRDKAG